MPPSVPLWSTGCADPTAPDVLCGRLRLRRLEPILLLLLPLAWSWILFDPGYSTDADSYFHVGVARRILEQGWISRFDWLPWTRLHDPFPDFFLGQHLALAPLVALFGPELAVRLGVLVLSTALAVSLYLILRRRGVPSPALWLVPGMLAVPVHVAYAVFLKGGTTFFVLLVWLVDAVLAERSRRIFVLSALSVFVYVGAPLLLPFALVHLVVVRGWEGRWAWRPVALTLLGLVVGMVVNPFWPAQWGYLAAELGSIFGRAAVPPLFASAEWAELGGPAFVALVAPLLLAWGVLFVRQLGRSARVPAAVGTLAAAVLGMLGAGLLTGTKLLETAAVLSFLGVPLAAAAMRPWPRLAPWLAGLAALAFVAVNARNVRPTFDTLGRPRPAEYQAMGRWIAEHAGPTEVVLCAWEDFPGFFAFAGEQRYVGGWNMQFLADQDPRRYQAYYLLFSGRIRDPERLLPTYFDDARLIIVHRAPRNDGDAALAASLEKNPAFEEIAGAVPRWRVFRLKR